MGLKIGNVFKEIEKITTQPLDKAISNILNKGGEYLNNITGVTASARQQAEANEKLQNDAMQFNAEQANIERNWQEEMSNSARQRAIEDAQKAGINPILAVGGGGASSGAGASATAPGASTGAGVGMNPVSMITDLIKAVNNTAKTNAEVNNINADTQNKKQTHENGGNGGTGVTRTLEWIGNKTKKAISARSQELKNTRKEHGPWSKEFWSK